MIDRTLRLLLPTLTKILLMAPVGVDTTAANVADSVPSEDDPVEVAENEEESLEPVKSEKPKKRGQSKTRKASKTRSKAAKAARPKTLKLTY